MLAEIGVNSMDELIAQTMPQDILLQEPLDLDEPLAEQEHLNTMYQMAQKNQMCRSYIGRGWYGAILPLSNAISWRTLCGTPPTPPIRQR